MTNHHPTHSDALTLVLQHLQERSDSLWEPLNENQYKPEKPYEKVFEFFREGPSGVRHDFVGTGIVMYEITAVLSDCKANETVRRCHTKEPEDIRDSVKRCGDRSDQSARHDGANT